MDSKKLGWVEFGRGCAAFVVLLAHGFYADVPADQYGYVFLWGRWGVCFFFVLSGFIIAYVHWRDIGSPDRARNFWWRRFVRIFPTYWLALFVFLFVRNVLGSADHRIELSAFNVAGNAVLWPGIGELMLPMAWTLRHEFLFYALFSISILNARIGAAMFLIWLALLLWVVANQTPCQMLTIASDRCMKINAATLDGSTPLWRLITLNVNLYFFAGMALALSLRSGRIGRVALLTTSATVVIVAVEKATASIYALAVFQGLVIISIVALTIWLSSQLRAPRLALWFGAISYPLYLFHMTMMLIAHGVAKRLAPNFPWMLTFILALALTFAVSHVVTYWFEPLFRRRTRAPNCPAPTSSVTE